MALLLLGTLLAPAGIGGAIFGLIAALPAGRSWRLLSATTGWVLASAVAYVATRFRVGASFYPEELFWTGMVVGVLVAVASPATLLRRTAPRRSGDSTDC